MIVEILTKQFFNLAIFRLAAEHGSLSRAANALRITQPAATRGLARLEESLGVRLLDRTASGVRPTEFGRAILDHTAAATRAITEAGRDLGALRRAREGQVACGTVPVNMAMIGAAAERFTRDYPARSLRLEEGSTLDLIGLLRDSELDLAIGTRVDDSDEGEFVVEPLLDEQIGIYARKDHPLARQEPLTLAELLDTGRWLIPGPRTHLHGVFHQELASRRLEPPRRFINASSPIAARWLVEKTDCLALSTSLVHHAELRSGAVIMLAVDWLIPPTKHVLYRRKRVQMSRQALAFIEAIKAEAAHFRLDIPTRP